MIAPISASVRTLIHPGFAPVERLIGFDRALHRQTLVRIRTVAHNGFHDEMSRYERKEKRRQVTGKTRPHRSTGSSSTANDA
jgi:hypothetical protein